jgi:polysaccharide biosynthesis protein PslG
MSAHNITYWGYKVKLLDSDKCRGRIIFSGFMRVLVVPCQVLFLLCNVFGAPIAVAGEFVFGIGTHLSGGNRPIEKSLDKLAAVGATSLRDDIPWAAVEQWKGELHIPTRWDILVSEARKRNIAPLLVLDYGNKFYDGGGKPHSDEGIAAFTRYAEFVVSHFKGRVLRYEIWNEWEQNVGLTRAGSAEDYVRLVRSVYPAIKKVDPQAEVLVGAVSADGVRSGYLNQIVKRGVLDYADSLSLHAYVYRVPGFSGPGAWVRWIESIEGELAALQGKPISFYITEMGWPTNSGKNGVSEEKQAEYLGQVFVHAREMPFIKGIWWYDFQDDGSDSANPEHNFGIVREDFTEKPAYAEFRRVSK